MQWSNRRARIATSLSMGGEKIPFPELEQAESPCVKGRGRHGPDGDRLYLRPGLD